MTDDRYRIEPLGRHHDRAAFSCGNEALDRYLHERARRDMERQVSAVFVLVEIETEAIAGFHTLSASVVRLESLPPDVAKRLPRYDQLPATLLGRLAVDNRYRGQGLGELLLLDALHRALRTADTVASIAVIVDAKDDGARAFYERYGFVRLTDDPYRLYIPMGTIAKLVS